METPSRDANEPSVLAETERSAPERPRRRWLRELRRGKIPLRAIVVGPFLVQIFTAVGITGWLSVRYGRAAISDAIEQLGSATTARIDGHVKQYLNSAHQLHQINASTIENDILSTEDFEALETHFRSLVDLNPNIDYLYFANEEGHFMGVQTYPDGQQVTKVRDASTAPERWIYNLDEAGNRTEIIKQHDYDPRGRPWYIRAKQESRPTWSEVFNSADLGVLQISPVYPLYSEENEFVGVLAANLLLAETGKFLQDLYLSPNGETFIVERSGALIASSITNEVYAVGEDEEMERTLAANSLSPMVRATAEAISDRFGGWARVDGVEQFAYKLDGDRYMVRVSPFQDGRGLDWLVVLVVPEADFSERIEANARTTILLCALAALLATAIGLITSRWIGAPVLRLARASREMADGRLDLVRRSPIRELDTLALSFNDMAAQLRALVSELEDRVASRTAQLQQEKEKSEELLLNILPAPIADRLKQERGAIAEHFEEATILFADIVGFTPLSSRLSAVEIVHLLNEVFSNFDDLAEALGIEKIKTIGDAYMAVAGLPVPRPDHVEAMADMALAMQIAIEHIEYDAGEPLKIRIGINTGIVVAGVIGARKFIYDLWGDAVNVASRMESSGEPGKIQVTAATYERLKDKYEFAERGKVSVKGKGEMTTYWLLGRR